MVAVALLYGGYYFRYVPSTPVLLKVFIMSVYGILLNAFSVSVEMV